jgi:acetolactate synthase I/II/III large subunit
MGMTGAESLIRTLARAGADVCFANPGTTEMALVTALDAVPGVRAVLGLFEGVCTGAADGWARMTGRPAVTLLHLGPGLANGVANLHNARRARAPLVNLVGDHATWHASADAPLTSDIASLARPVSAWVRSAGSARGLAADGAEALAAAWGPPGSVATLIVPADCQWEQADGPAPLPPRPSWATPAEGELAAAAEGLRAGSAVLLLGGGALSARGLTAAARIQAACGCAVFVESFPARLERGQGLPAFPGIPYFPEQVAEALAGRRVLVLAGAASPVAFFGYPGQPSRLTPEGCATRRLAGPEHDVAGALEEVATRLGAGPLGALPARERPAPARGALTPQTLGQTLAALQPEGAVVVDEAATSGLTWSALAAAAPPHTVLSLTGGAIGQGLPCATGAALACPDRRVVAFQADGSAMYTLQALWTQAREGLPVATVICANRRYRILQVELARAGVAEPGPAARALTDLGRPALDWVALARGLGVEAWRAESAETFAEAFARALAAPGPALVEAVLAP